MAVSLPRPTRKDSPSTHAARERSPRLRGPKSLEERVLALELQGAVDRTEASQVRGAIKVLKGEIDEQTKVGLDLRREVFGARGTVANALAVIENKLSTMSAALLSKPRPSSPWTPSS